MFLCSRCGATREEDCKCPPAPAWEGEGVRMCRDANTGWVECRLGGGCDALRRITLYPRSALDAAVNEQFTRDNAVCLKRIAEAVAVEREKRCERESLLAYIADRLNEWSREIGRHEQIDNYLSLAGFRECIFGLRDRVARARNNDVHGTVNNPPSVNAPDGKGREG